MSTRRIDNFEEIKYSLKQYPVRAGINLGPLTSVILTDLNNQIERRQYDQNLTTIEYVVDIKIKYFRRCSNVDISVFHGMVDHIINDINEDILNDSDMEGYIIRYERSKDENIETDHMNCCCRCVDIIGKVILSKNVKLLKQT